MSEIIEIRVKRDERSIRLAELLRSLKSLKPSGRSHALTEAEAIGHARIVEVLLGALADPSPDVRGPAVTSLGRVASSLQHTTDGGYRRALANRHLMERARERAERPDIRGAALTSLRHSVPKNDPTACESLKSVVTQNAAAGVDEFWEVRGPATSTLGELGCRDSLGLMLSLLERDDVPMSKKAALATSLIRLESPKQSVPRLAAALERGVSPRVAGTIITALGLIGGDEVAKGQTVAALSRYIRSNKPALQAPGSRRPTEVEHNRISATFSLAVLGDRRALEVLQEVAGDGSEPEALRVEAIDTTRSLESPKAEQWLAQLAEESSNPLAVRIASLRALGRFAEEETIDRIDELFDGVSGQPGERELRQAILACLKERSTEGSGAAGRYHSLRSADGARRASSLEAGRRARTLDESVPLVKAEDFLSEVIESSTPTLVEFWAGWCGACRRMEPALKALAEEFRGRVRFVRVDVDEDEQLAGAFGVTGIPTFVMVAGGEPELLGSGVKKQAELQRMIAGRLAKRVTSN
jgi:thioredoxin 1